MRIELKTGQQNLENLREPWRAWTLKALVCEETVRLCLEQFGSHLSAVVLTGSLARDEATFVREGRGWKLLGDAEFVLVFNTRAPLPTSSAMQSVRQEIELNLRHRKIIQSSIDLSEAHPATLRRLPQHILTYELRHCGDVVWGDSQILTQVPDFPASEISLEDAWRLICNRMVELLEAAPAMMNGNGANSLDLRYRTLKLYLDTATSFLVFARAYAPTYKQRAEKLTLLANGTTETDRWPFDLEIFANQVAACTRWKLYPNEPGNRLPSNSWQEALRYARLLWRWELTQLMGADVSLPDLELLADWMRLQPPRKKLRGWLYVLRKCGWHRSWQNWPHWFRQSFQASPRYWVYAAAAKLLFGLPEMLNRSAQHAETEVNLEEVRTWLPLAHEPQRRDSLSGWQRLASQIVWNYHEFLERTRA